MNLGRKAHTVLAVFLSGCSPLVFSGDPFPYHEDCVYKKSAIAFVLGAGGAKGMAHIGIIEELTAAGIHPELIVGSSAGAIIGGLYAANPNIYALKNILIPVRRSNFLTFSVNSFPHALSDGEGLNTFLDLQLCTKEFNKLPIRFAAVATNLEFGTTRILTDKDDMVKSIVASAAVPGVLSPVKIGRYYYVDGAVTCPVPVEAAKKLGGQYVIAIELHSKLATQSPQHSLGIIMRALEINFNAFNTHIVKQANFLIQVPFEDISTFDDSANQTIYEIGKKAARKALPKLCADLKKHFKKPICTSDIKDPYFS